VTRTAAVACTVGLLTAAGIFLAVQRGRTIRAARALAELPSTTAIVLAFDTEAIQRSASAKALIGAVLDEAQLSDIETTCQLDPIRDLSEVVVWVRGTERNPLESFGAQLEGRTVDARTIAACHASLVGARGDTVVRVESPTGPLLASEDRRSAVAVVDPRTVVAGSVQTVAEVMAVRRGIVPALRERDDFAELWPATRRDAALAAVAQVPEHWKAALARVAPFDEEPELIEAVRTIAMSAKTGAEPIVTLRVDTDTPTSAEAVAERIRAWAAGQPDGVEPLSSLLQSARVRLAGSAVFVTLDVSALRPKPDRR